MFMMNSDHLLMFTAVCEMLAFRYIQSRASNPNLTATEFVPVIERLELNELNIPSGTC